MYKGRLDPFTGNPQILSISPDGKKEAIIATGGYHSFAFLKDGNGDAFMVISPYFEGIIPQEYIGVLLEVKIAGTKDVVWEKANTHISSSLKMSDAGGPQGPNEKPEEVIPPES